MSLFGLVYAISKEEILKRYTAPSINIIILRYNKAYLIDIVTLIFFPIANQQTKNKED
jgi:hypothetical protein